MRSNALLYHQFAVVRSKLFGVLDQILRLWLLLDSGLVVGAHPIHEAIEPATFGSTTLKVRQEPKQ